MFAVVTSIRHSGIETLEQITSGRAFQEAFEPCRKQHYLYLEPRAFCRRDARTTEFSGLHGPIQRFNSLTVHRPRSTPWPAAAGRRRVLCSIVALSLFKDRLCSACLILVTTNSGKTALAAPLSFSLHRTERRLTKAPVFAPRQHKAPTAFETLPPSSTSPRTPKSFVNE